MTISTILAVASGGAIGAVARFGVHRGMTAWHGEHAAWSTLGINVLGSACLGFFIVWFGARQGPIPAFLMVGVLGAFTTFSTFAVDALGLYRDKGLNLAAIYVGLSVVLSIAAALGGATLARSVS